VSTIHDLGYQRYVGTRRTAATRWRVIVRNQLSIAWKTWWRYKAVLALAVIVTFVAGGFMYLASDQRVRAFGRAGIPQMMKEVAIPVALQWYCRIAFLLSLTLSAGVVATDMQSGAFTFYFARSIRPVDYVIGKLAGMVLLVATITLAGPVLLAALRIGLSGDDTESLADALPVLLKVFAIGGLATLVYAAVPLGFSALVPNRRYALALWAAYYLVVGAMAIGIGYATSHSLGALQLPSAIEAVTLRLFDVEILHGLDAKVPLSAGLISIGAHVVVAIGLVGWRVRAAQQSGVGGAT